MKRKLAQILSVLSVLFILAPVTLRCSADSPTEQSAFLISPSAIAVPVNDTFLVTFNLTDAQQLCLWQIYLTYNASDVQLADMWVPDANVFAGHVLSAPPLLIDNTGGAALYGAFLVGDDDSVNVTNGVICLANFTVLAAGKSTIQIVVGDPNNNGTLWEDYTLGDHIALVSNCTITGLGHLFADVNRDGAVNMKDVALLARAFGSHAPNYDYPGEPASPNWNPACDFDGDGLVDMADVALLCSCFGQT